MAEHEAAEGHESLLHETGKWTSSSSKQQIATSSTTTTTTYSVTAAQVQQAVGASATGAVACDASLFHQLVAKLHGELCAALTDHHDSELNSALRSAMQAELSLRRSSNAEASPSKKQQDAAVDEQTLARVRVVDRLERDLADRQSKLDERERSLLDRESQAEQQTQELRRMQSVQPTSEASHGSISAAANRKKTPTVSPTRRNAGDAPLVSTTKEALKREIQSIEEKKAALRSRLLEVQNSAASSRKSSAAAGGVREALERAQGVAAQAQFIEIEVETLAQLDEALTAGARMVLLDNMTFAQMREAVALNAGRAILEVSGGVNMGTVREIAATGVDRISVGALTKDVRATDFSMRFEDL